MIRPLAAFRRQHQAPQPELLGRGPRPFAACVFVDVEFHCVALLGKCQWLVVSSQLSVVSDDRMMHQARVEEVDPPG